METWQNDAAVLLIFFARSDTFARVFEAVRAARPRTLLLWQDGPREGRPDDVEGIERCRKIAENIDWECEVHRNYHEKNIGCDPSTFMAQKWAFSLVDKCIILEDDMVAHPSFFPYCEELLDKYENDQRVNHICGVNFFGEMTDCPYDYLFAYNGTGAWASWRRVAEEWDETYSFLDNEYGLKNIASRGKALTKITVKVAEQRRTTGKAYWESILGLNCMLQNRYVIIPKRNLVTNIGMDENSTHGANLKLVPKSTRRLFNMPVWEQPFPMKHPPFVVLDEQYYKDMCKINAWGRPVSRFFRKIAYLFRCLLHGSTGRIFKAIKRKLSREK